VRLEEKLAEFKRTAAALTFSSGYATRSARSARSRRRTMS